MDRSETAPRAPEEKATPRVAERSDWEVELAGLREEEKRLTRARDALAARRRRMPMVRIDAGYSFEGPSGRVGLGELFEGRSQLILYNFMFAPGAAQGCSGCSMFVDNLGHPAHLHARDTTIALVSRAPLAQILPFQERMGWTLPWYSSFGSSFNHDMGATTEAGETFKLSVFLRRSDEVYLTYTTDGRGVEQLGTSWSLLDLTPYGRQETWEDSPPGWPQSPPYGWWRHHDRYGAD